MVRGEGVDRRSMRKSRVGSCPGNVMKNPVTGCSFGGTCRVGKVRVQGASWEAGCHGQESGVKISRRLGVLLLIPIAVRSTFMPR